MTSSNIERRISESDMSPFQVMAVGICLVINMLDGFDVLAIAFAAPEIAKDWDLSPARLGILFSAGLAGMMLGSIFLAPQADRYGRRAIILACLVIVSIGMLASAAAQSLNQLLALRLLTGIGVGAMLPGINTMVAEYSSDKRRQLAISLLQTGYPLGAIFAGVISAFLIAKFGWRSVFVFGGMLSIIMLPLVYLRLPESLDFLLNARPPGALQRINSLLGKLGHETVASLPEQVKTEKRQSPARELLSSTYIVRTVCICGTFVVMMSTWYFVVNWTPKILVDSGMSLDVGISGGLLLSIGGVIGGLLLGYLSSRFAIRRLVATFMLIGAVAMVVFGQLASPLSVMLIVTFIIGFCLAGGMIGIYAIVPDLFPARIRTAGTGWAIGIGRVGAVLGPYVAGLMIGAGWERALYYFVLATPLLLSSILVLRVPSSQPGES